MIVVIRQILGEQDLLKLCIMSMFFCAMAIMFWIFPTVDVRLLGSRVMPLVYQFFLGVAPYTLILTVRLKELTSAKASRDPALRLAVGKRCFREMRWWVTLGTVVMNTVFFVVLMKRFEA